MKVSSLPLTSAWVTYNKAGLETSRLLNVLKRYFNPFIFRIVGSGFRGKKYSLKEKSPKPKNLGL